MEENIIHVQKISKQFKISKREAGMKNAIKSFFKREYKTINALDEISFDIKEGEIVGYIGPNGAGKSTTIKIMCGILVPSSGECIINGYVPWKDRKKYVKNIGVVFGQRSGLWWDVPPIDSFELLKDIYEIPQKEYEKKLAELVENLDLDQIKNIPTRQLSLGQRMKCEIAAALLHNPKNWIIDEPMTGLDPKSTYELKQIMRKITEQNHTVFFSTQILDVAEKLCDRIGIINKGELLFVGTLEEIRNELKENKSLEELFMEITKND